MMDKGLQKGQGAASQMSIALKGWINEHAAQWSADEKVEVLTFVKQALDYLTVNYKKNKSWKACLKPLKEH